MSASLTREQVVAAEEDEGYEQWRACYRRSKQLRASGAHADGGSLLCFEFLESAGAEELATTPAEAEAAAGGPACGASGLWRKGAEWGSAA